MNKYRFGFNGMEKDYELNYDFGQGGVGLRKLQMMVIPQSSFESGMLDPVEAVIIDSLDITDSIGLRFTATEESMSLLIIGESGVEDNHYYMDNFRLRDGFVKSVDCRGGHIAYSYRYSFNSQEAEYEINRSVTFALHWMYDGRLGRRWNTDPVVKPWRSSYDAFSNNPIVKVDPKGDDDYFDHSGKYLGNDGTSTHNIRVVKSAELYHGIIDNILSGAHRSSQINILQSSSDKLESVQFNSTAQRKMLNKIAAHYYGKIGGSGSVGSKDSGKENSLAHTNQELQIMIATYNGRLPELSGNYNNLMSTLDHERIHKINNDPNKAGFNYRDHANVYLQQVQSDLFAPTTDEYKSGNAGSAAKYLISAYNEGQMSDTQVGEYMKQYNAANSVAQMSPVFSGSGKLGVKFNVTKDGEQRTSETTWEGATSP